MASGRQTLHDIDRAIVKARARMNEAAELPARISSSLAEIQKQRAIAFKAVASERLELIEAGGGGDLGYVDRQAEKLLKAHEKQKTGLDQRIAKSLTGVEKLEAQRREQEKIVDAAVTAYDKKAAEAEIKILKDQTYQGQLVRVEDAQSALSRAEEKLAQSEDHQNKNTRKFLRDPFFAYLQNRRYGTPSAKGWFLTKALDRWVAGISEYDFAVHNFERFIQLPKSLSVHVNRLDDNLDTARKHLQDLEADILKNEGLTQLRKSSLAAQKKLESIDEKIDAAEAKHQGLRDEQMRLNGGDSGPIREAIELLTQTLSQKSYKHLRRLAAQTRSRDDDRAIENLRDLARQAESLSDDQEDARDLLKKYQRSLKELESVRHKYKRRRYDAPSSVIQGGDLLAAILGQVLAGAASGNDFWRQIQRAQRTVKRYSDYDFGGGDWTEGLRLPRDNSWSKPSRRTAIPRSPRRSLPRAKTSRSRKQGFKTGGGF